MNYFWSGSFWRSAHVLAFFGAVLPLACDGGPAIAPQDTSPPSMRPRSRKAGASCQDDLVCESLRCSVDGSSAACGQCLTVRHLGETCGGALETCTHSAACIDGRCATLSAGLGEPCSLNHKAPQLGDCDVDLKCAQTGESWRGICVPGTRCLEFGGECVDNDTYLCQGKVCGEGEICSDLNGFSRAPSRIMRSCVLRTSLSLAAGGRCSDGSDQLGFCDDGTVCQEVNGLCGTPLGEGAACGSPIVASCGANMVCESAVEAGPGDSGSCSRLPDGGLGARCNGAATVNKEQYVQFYGCDPGLECRAHTCQAACE